MKNVKLTILLFAALCAASSCTKKEADLPAAEVSQSSKESNQTLAAKRGTYPSYNISPLPPDASGMPSNAVQLAASMKLGWNLGNTLEAIGSETAWGNPVTTQALIDKVKQSGFNAVRIPCSWDQYANASTAQIQAQWLDHVKQVVQYCINDGLYVILNVHWDGGWLDGHINTQDQASVNAKQKAFWEQIATKMRGFDEHLMFASANEPPVSNATEMSILLSYHQTFVNAVRSTGGRNSYRVLVVQGPSTDIDNTTTLMNTLPSDPTASRMMVEVHYYGPYQFCGLTTDATWGSMFYYWGSGYHSTTDPSRNATWGEESYVIDEFQKMKTKFINNGIPVVLGEYGAIRRTTLTGNALTLHLASRAYWDKYITQQAKANGLLPFYWDEGSLGNNGFGIMNRPANTVGDQQALDALILGAQ
ncbi:glycoside hydrolase family 5 protein [Mucilaginibacter sp.]|uniref:glycoside hydrolase family 5 protein n=1 Tax=Mucilaginibacter sp. TaxID=1882438 RepID=UPI0032655F9C